MLDHILIICLLLLTAVDEVRNLRQDLEARRLSLQGKQAEVSSPTSDLFLRLFVGRKCFDITINLGLSDADGRYLLPSNCLLALKEREREERLPECFHRIKDFPWA